MPAGLSVGTGRSLQPDRFTFFLQSPLKEPEQQGEVTVGVMERNKQCLRLRGKNDGSLERPCARPSCRQRGWALVAFSSLKEARLGSFSCFW